MIEPVLLNIYKIKKSHSGVKLTVLTVSSQILCILKTAANGVYPQLLRQLAWNETPVIGQFQRAGNPRWNLLFRAIRSCGTPADVFTITTSRPSDAVFVRDWETLRRRSVSRCGVFWSLCILFSVFRQTVMRFIRNVLWYTFIVQFCVKRNNLSKKIYHWKTDFKVIIQFDNRVISNMDLFDNYNKTLEEVSYITVIKRFNFE